MAGAADLRSVARQLANVPDDAAAELVRWMVPRSKQIGGRMMWFGKNVQLAARPKRPRHDRDQTTVTVVGVPISCWSIKSYGRKGGYDVKPKRKEALALKGFAPGVFFAHVTVQRSTSGDRRWDRLIAEADLRFPHMIEQHIDKAVA
jgi:hypothetical protein